MPYQIMFDAYAIRFRVWGLGFWLGSIPHPVMGTTKDCCRYTTALLTPHLVAISVGAIDLRFRVWRGFRF